MSDNSEFKKLEAVKELIFGSEIENFKKHFEVLEDKIKNLDAKLEEIKGSISSDMANSTKELTQKIDAADKQLSKLASSKLDTSKIGQLISKLGQKLVEESK